MVLPARRGDSPGGARAARLCWRQAEGRVLHWVTLLVKMLTSHIGSINSFRQE